MKLPTSLLMPPLVLRSSALLAFVAAVLLAPGAASAKDLNGRLGLGAMATFGGGAGPAELSVRYGLPTGKPTLNIALELDAGVDIDTAVGTRLEGGLRLLYAPVVEDNMNLYLGAGVGYRYDTTSGVSTGGLHVQPAVEAEFFAFGLENLGFVAGIGLDLGIGDSVTVRTVGGVPMVGMHYYF